MTIKRRQRNISNSLSGELELFLEGYFIDTKLELPTCRKQSNIDYIRYFFEIDEYDFDETNEEYEYFMARAHIKEECRLLLRKTKK